MKKALGIIVPFIIAGLGLYWVMRDIPWAELRTTADTAVTDMNVGFIALACVAYLGVAAMHGLRFHKFMGVSRLDSLAIYAVATMLNTFIPARAGDLYKPLQSAKLNGFGFAVMTGRAITDLAVWGAGFVIWLLPLFPFTLKVVQEMPLLKWALVAQLVGVVLGFGAALGIERYIRKHSIQPKWPPLRKGLELLATLRESLDFKKVRSVALWVLLGWGFEMIVPWAVAHAFHLDISLLQGAVVMMAVTVAMVVPAPGGVGPFEAAATTTFETFGADKPLAAFLAISYHLVFIVLPFFIGIAAWVFQARRPAAVPPVS